MKSKASHHKSVAKVLWVDCANENHQIVKNGFYMVNGIKVDIQEELQSSIDESIHYHYNHRFPVIKQKKEVYETRFHVVNCGVIQAAMDIHNSFRPSSATISDSSTINATMNNHIGILNFASAKNPGGGYLKGATAQEESICRSSLLFPSLQKYEDMKDHYYQINRNKGKGFGTLYSNCAIFSPLVPIIRDDGPNTNLLEETFLASFVTSPAPNKSAIIQQNKNRTKSGKRNANVEGNLISSTDNQELQNIMIQRIKTILNIFEVNGCTDLILGAFGCGVFGNDPEFVSAIFHQVIREDYEGVFQSVTFAIWTPPNCQNPMEDPNYSAFMKQFFMYGDN